VIRSKRTLSRSASVKGQALVEMALILPLLLALVGGAVDLARAYQAWLTVESATRNAAEYVATSTTITDSAGALTAAKNVVCTETKGIPGYVASGSSCTAPSVTVTSFSTSSTDPGASTKNPIATARITVSVQFQTLVPWPLLPRGGLTLSADRSYSIVRGR